MSDPTPSLVKFLLARITEDEAAAQLAADEIARLDRIFAEPEVPSHGWRGWSYPGPTITARGPVAEHIYRFDPARVLAECTTKREIVELHSERSHGGCTSCATEASASDGFAWVDPEPWPCDTIRALAAPFADHPDFDSSWRAVFGD